MECVILTKYCLQFILPVSLWCGPQYCLPNSGGCIGFSIRSIRNVNTVIHRWNELESQGKLRFNLFWSEIEPLIYNIRCTVHCQYNLALYLQGCPSSLAWRFLCCGLLNRQRTPQLMVPQEAPGAPLLHKELKHWAHLLLLLRHWKVPKH